MTCSKLRVWSVEKLRPAVCHMLSKFNIPSKVLSWTCSCIQKGMQIVYVDVCRWEKFTWAAFIQCACWEMEVMLQVDMWTVIQSSLLDVVKYSATRWWHGQVPSSRVPENTKTHKFTHLWIRQCRHIRNRCALLQHIKEHWGQRWNEQTDSYLLENFIKKN